MKLEASLPVKPLEFRIIRTIVDCSGKTPIGYRDNHGTEIMRLPDETEESFDQRLFEAIPIDETERHIFEPIYSD